MAETIIELYRENVERLTEVRQLIDSLGAGAEDKDGPLKLQEAVLRARVDAMSKMFIGKENGIPTPCNDLILNLVLAKQSLYLGR